MCTQINPEDFKLVSVVGGWKAGERTASKWEDIAMDHNAELVIGVPEGIEFEGKHSSKGKTFQCDHCGTHFNVGTLWINSVTQKHVFIGWICGTTVMGSTGSELDKKAIERKIKAHKSRVENKIKRAELWNWISTSNDVELQLAFWVGLECSIPMWDAVSQIAHQTFIKAKKPSDKQIVLIKKHSVLAVERHQAKLDEKANEVLADVPVTDERITITGKVLCTKWVENNFGGSVKFLVHDHVGFKVWGTVPSSIQVEKGDEVTFDAKVTPSRDDSTFGFFKRPTKASVVEAVTA